MERFVKGFTCLFSFLQFSFLLLFTQALKDQKDSLYVQSYLGKGLCSPGITSAIHAVFICFLCVHVFSCCLVFVSGGFMDRQHPHRNPLLMADPVMWAATWDVSFVAFRRTNSSALSIQLDFKSSYSRQCKSYKIKIKVWTYDVWGVLSFSWFTCVLFLIPAMARHIVRLF